MGPSRDGARSVRLPLSVVALALTLGSACGARSGALFDPPEGRPRPVPSPEVCNGLDDDLDGLVAVGAIDGGASEAGVVDGGARDAGMDGGALDAGEPRDAGLDAGGGTDASAGDAGGGMDASAGDAGTGDVDRFVDEDFRDEIGRYVHVDHCGACGRPCRIGRPHELEVGCALLAESPACVALRCEAGFVPSRSGVCVPLYERLCLPCADDGDCGDFEGARCANVGDERRCSIDCALSCPSGYACAAGVCAPSSGSCTCEAGDDFDLACALEDPEGNLCPGSATCRSGVLSECLAPPELCDHEDDDCNGTVDDGFRDARGAYSLDVHNCGECGVDCTLSTVPEGDLVCGGDPFAPTCVLHCPDTDDGLDIGDRIDADRDIATGCECTLGSLTDEAGPVRTSGSMLDVNCDGADGVVVESFYVAEDGDDAAPGSPSRPLRTLRVAMMRALESLETSAPRPHVFIASGTYTETLELPDGVRVHGGYRRDFLSLDPSGFRVEIRAPAGGSAPGGAAVVVRGAGATRETLLEWVSVQGLDATRPGEARFGLYALDPGPLLILRDLDVHAGAAGEGIAGVRGAAGVGMTAPPMEGEIPRGAIEDASHLCQPGAMNVVRGGAGGRNTCGGLDTRGGDGGAASCPAFAMFQGAGANAMSVRGLPGGAGGAGGQDSNGPITSDTGACPVAVCCGLADFSVPTDFMGPQPGRAGREGGNGASGGACGEPFGRFVGDEWQGVDGTGGTDGSPGSGGGGGGAGGGAVMDWFDGACEFADGIGGGGGGGGAGGCGGAPGTGGTSGAPSVAILVRYTRAPGAGGPTIRGALLAPSEGGRGGDGGAGGEGGRGAAGAFGGTIPRDERSTPTLSGPFPGGRGGTGGSGGAGGGGGGGCGGASVGIWVTGLSSEPAFVAAWRTGNTFRLGVAGARGRGGGGPAAGPDGAEGGTSDVLVR